MVGPWPDRPGTLRALMTILKGSCHIICRPCRRYAPLSAEREDLDRPYEPCPSASASVELLLDLPDCD